MSRPNVYEGEFPMHREEMGIRGRPFARAAGARELGGTVYELEPGASGFNLHGHYGNDAKELGITQPAMSQKIMDLENQLRTRLLQRGPGRAAKRFTEAGLELHRRGLRIAKQIEDAEGAVRALAFLPQDTICVGLTFDNRELVAAAVEAVVPKSVAGHPEPEELDATFPRHVAGASRPRPVSRPSSVCSCRRV